MFSCYDVRVIRDIIARLENISDNKDKQPLYVLGGYIVGATLVRGDYEKIITEYPAVETIAELGAELETLEDDEYADTLFRQFQHALVDLKQTIVGK